MEGANLEQPLNKERWLVIPSLLYLRAQAQTFFSHEGQPEGSFYCCQRILSYLNEMEIPRFLS